MRPAFASVPTSPFALTCVCRLVIETLKDASLTEPTRKAFRLVGGILVERTVGDVLPELQSRHEQVRPRLHAR